MKIIIPVAGTGSRLRPYTFSVPKVMLNVAGKPILSHIMTKLMEIDIDEIIVITGYLGDMVKDYLTKTFPVKFSFVDQEERLGLSHAVLLTKKFFSQDDSGFIVLGDTIFSADMESIFNTNESKLGVKVVEDPKRFGVVELVGNKIAGLTEKPENPKSNLALVGLYYVKNMHYLFKKIEDQISMGKKTKNEYQLTDAFQLMINEGESFSTFSVDEWYDCGKYESMLQANKHLLLKRPQKIIERENVVINMPSFVAPNAKIENAVIGPFATIASNATVKNAIVVNSIISEEAEVDTVLVRSSIVGKKARIKGDFRKINVGDFSDVSL